MVLILIFNLFTQHLLHARHWELDPGDNAAVKKKKKQEETPVLMVLTLQWERQTKKSVRNNQRQRLQLLSLGLGAPPPQ